MKAHDIRAAVDGLPVMKFHELAKFNNGTVGIFRAGAGTSPWELHPNDDELLHAIEGEVDIIVLTEEGPRTTTIHAGSIFVVPRGHWHRHRVNKSLVELYVTPGETEHSNADDPREGL